MPPPPSCSICPFHCVLHKLKSALHLLWGYIVSCVHLVVPMFMKKLNTLPAFNYFPTFPLLPDVSKPQHVEKIRASAEGAGEHLEVELKSGGVINICSR